MQKQSKIKKLVATVHLGILDLAIILTMLGIWGVAYSEAAIIYSYSVAIEGKEHTSFLQVGIYPFIGSLLTMLVPVYLMFARSSFSPKGKDIDVFEMTVILALILGALMMMYMTYHAMDSSLQYLLELPKTDKRHIDRQLYEYRIEKNLFIIITNAFLDILIGMLSIYEIRDHHLPKIIPIKPSVTVVPDSKIVDIDKPNLDNLAPEKKSTALVKNPLNQSLN